MACKVGKIAYDGFCARTILFDDFFFSTTKAKPLPSPTCPAPPPNPRGPCPSHPDPPRALPRPLRPPRALRVEPSRGGGAEGSEKASTIGLRGAAAGSEGTPGTQPRQGGAPCACAVGPWLRFGRSSCSSTHFCCQGGCSRYRRAARISLFVVRAARIDTRFDAVRAGNLQYGPWHLLGCPECCQSSILVSGSWPAASAGRDGRHGGLGPGRGRDATSSRRSLLQVLSWVTSGCQARTFWLASWANCGALCAAVGVRVPMESRSGRVASSDCARGLHPCSPPSTGNSDCLHIFERFLRSIGRAFVCLRAHAHVWVAWTRNDPAFPHAMLLA